MPVTASVAMPMKSQVFAWTTAHLAEAAAAWDKAAEESEKAFAQHVASIQAPGGTEWTGTAASTAYDDAREAQDVVTTQSSIKRECARIARRGSGDIRGAQQATVNAIQEAEGKGYQVAEDLTVTDTKSGGSDGERITRKTEAQQLTEFLRWHAQGLASTDAKVAEELKAEAAGLEERKLTGGGTQPMDFKQAPPTDPPAAPFQGITEDEFKKIYKKWNVTSTDGITYTPLSPEEAEAKAKGWTHALNAAMEEAQINTPLRQAAFLAESAEETDWGATLTEYGDGSEYQGRLGNVNPGDGMLFKGRGGLQLTGRSNYELAAQALGLPSIVTKPNEVSQDVTTAFRTAGWFWRHGNGDLNTFADQGDIVEISRRINGGDNGLNARIQNYREILNMLNAGQ